MRRLADQLLDFLGGLGRTLRQFAHLLSNDCEALASFASACRLDACVQRQQVGLEGDLVDDHNDIGNLARGMFNTLHRVDCRCNDIARDLRRLIGFACSTCRLPGALGGVRHVDGDLIQCRSGLFEGRSPLLCTPREICRALGNLTGSAVHRFDRARNFRQRITELLNGVVEVGSERLEIRRKGLVQTECQIP